MDAALWESVWFYTGADYLIINAFLWQNRDALEACIGTAYQNNRGVLREAKEMTPAARFGTSAREAQRIADAYRRRTPDVLDEGAKRQMLAVAIEDIRNLCGAMRPVGAATVLYRNVDRRFMMEHPEIGREIDLPGITSTSTTGQEIDYGKGDFLKASHRYRIHVRAETPALVIENDGRAENEVLLPPMRHRVTGIEQSEDRITIDLAPVVALDVEALIRSASETFGI